MARHSLLLLRTRLAELAIGRYVAQCADNVCTTRRDVALCRHLRHHGHAPIPRAARSIEGCSNLVTRAASTSSLARAVRIELRHTPYGFGLSDAARLQARCKQEMVWRAATYQRSGLISSTTIHAYVWFRCGSVLSRDVAELGWSHAISVIVPL
jgi:hypothetical protein